MEGGTEAAQEVIAQIAGKLANENREILGEEGVKAVFDSFVAGVIVGGPLGGLGGIARPQSGSLEDQLEVEDALDAFFT